MKYKKRNVRWMLVVYDLLVYELSAVLLLGLYGGNDKLSMFRHDAADGSCTVMCIFN